MDVGLSRSYFSNGTEWDLWSARWCDRCVHDHDLHCAFPEEPGCGLVLSMWVGANEAELVGRGESMICQRFQTCSCAS